MVVIAATALVVKAATSEVSIDANCVVVKAATCAVVKTPACAVVKARACAGDFVAAKAFLDEMQAFVWRRNLDFAAIQDVHSIKRQINAFRGDFRSNQNVDIFIFSEIIECQFFINSAVKNFNS